LQISDQSKNITINLPFLRVLGCTTLFSGNFCTRTKVQQQRLWLW